MQQRGKMGTLSVEGSGEDSKSDEECASTSSSLTLAHCFPPLVATLRIAPPDYSHLAPHPRSASATEPAGQFPFASHETWSTLQNLRAEPLDVSDLPPGWPGLQTGLPAQLPALEAAAGGAVTLVERGGGGKALDDAALHFVATQSTIKKIFALPYSNESVTVAVRVGPGAEPGTRTLILTAVVGNERHRLAEASRARVDEVEPDGDSGGQGAPGRGEGAPRGSGRRKNKKKPSREETAASKFLCYSVSPEGGRSSGEGSDPSDGTLFKSVEDGLELLGFENQQFGEEGMDEQLSDGDQGVFGDQRFNDQRFDERFGGQRGGKRGGQRAPPGQGGARGRGAAGVAAGVMGQSEEGRLLRRAVQFRFNDLSLMLGSDTVIFNRGARSPELSLRVEDAESEVTKLTCLDYWLDNTLNNVSQTAVCYHKEGKVHGYSMVRTEDLPSWRDGVAFEPQAVMESASSVLSFLQSHCTKEAGTYWLYRPEGSEEVQLFCLDEADTAGPLLRKGGMLCFKIARRLQQHDRTLVASGGAAKHRLRTARLFLNALSVLSEEEHAGEVALSHEGVGDSLVGAGWRWRGGEGDGGAVDNECGFYVDADGNLQEEAAGSSGDEEDVDPNDVEGDGATSRPNVGDTAEWGSAYPISDLENAMEHYAAAAGIPRPDPSQQHLRRVSCKAAKCGVAMAMRLLKRGNVAHALVRSVKAFEGVTKGSSPQREEQELMSEAMQVWAEMYLALCDRPKDEILQIRAEVEEARELDRVLAAGFSPAGGFCSTAFSPGGSSGAGAGDVPAAHQTPTVATLGGEKEENCNLAIKFLVRALQFCYSAPRRAELLVKLGSVYKLLGTFYTTTGRFTRAHQHYHQGIRVFQQIGDTLSAASLSCCLGSLFLTRAHAAPHAPGITEEQGTDLQRARALFLEAQEGIGLAPLDPSKPGGRKGEEVARDVRAGLADIDMAVGIGLASGKGQGMPPEVIASLIGEGAEGEEVLSALAAAEKALQRAAVTLEADGSPQAAAAHLHLAALLAREEFPASGDPRSPKDASQQARWAKARRRLADMHLEKACALAATLPDAVRVRCIQAELSQRRGGIHELSAALDSLLTLADPSHHPPPPSHDSGARTGGGGRRAEVVGRDGGKGGGVLELWSPFDGGWGGAALQRCLGDAPPAEEEDALVWTAALRQTQAVLRCLVKSHSAQNNAQAAERYKDEYRASLLHAQQHPPSAFLPEMRRVHKLIHASASPAPDKE